MLITNIELQNFRNYKQEKIELSPFINIFYGDNAQGKTNIIESIFFIAFGKSFRTNKDKEIINKNSSFFNIKMNYKNKDRTGNIKVQVCNKKTIEINGIKIKKLSELLGTINIVLFTPEDITVLKDGPSKRRRFLDMMISQIRPNYVYNLNRYFRILDERNTYLKQVTIKNYNKEMFKIWNEKLTEYGYNIAKYRNEFIEKIKEKIEPIHKEITEEKENIKIKYITDCIDKEKFYLKLENSLNIDLQRGYTSIGIQKDDFMIYINEEPINIYGSQGQNRTAMLSLKLSELQIIKEETQENPILLLDDFMSELDEKRIKNFLKYIKNTQVIITCTKHINIENINNKSFYVNEGNVQNIK